MLTVAAQTSAHGFLPLNGCLTLICSSLLLMLLACLPDLGKLGGCEGAGPGSVSCDMMCDTGLTVAGLTACDAACCTAFGMDRGEGRPACTVSFVMLLEGRV